VENVREELILMIRLQKIYDRISEAITEQRTAPDDVRELAEENRRRQLELQELQEHKVLIRMLDEVKSGMIEDGTALGDGLATAVSRLRDSKAISKVIILLTDGVNNMGSLDPVSAAEIAKLYGIRIYTIGVGSRGMAPYPVQTPFGVQYQNMEVNIDEALLKKVADMTDGQYFRATSNRKLKEIYDEIDKMEKSKIDVTEFYQKTEEFELLALLALLFLALEMLLKNTIFKTTP